jgi:hypothetical protein
MADSGKKPGFTYDESDSQDLSLPPVEKETSTRWGCVAALIFGFLVSLTCFVVAGFIFSYRLESLAYPLPFSSIDAELLALLINFGITLCLEGLAYIHAISLRWALFSESRLQFNTNIRLFTSSKKVRANSWYGNLLSAVCLVLCYASTSLLFIRGMAAEDGLCHRSGCTFVNPVALCALGLGLLGQFAIGVWCMGTNLRTIPTWGSNPLNTTLSARHSGTTRRAGRCMLSVHQTSLAATPHQPSIRQSNLRKAIPVVDWFVALAWLLVALVVAWTIAIIFVTKNTQDLSGGGGPWEFLFTWSGHNVTDVIPSNQFNVVSLTLFSTRLRAFTTLQGQFVLAILFVCAVQCLQTIGLHCSELIVNVSRDEDFWRQAGMRTQKEQSFGSGARLESPAFFSALQNWRYAVLFTLKAALHWLLGQSLVPSFEYGSYSFSVAGFDMNHSRLLVYTGTVFGFAVYITYLAIRRPFGPQPATWGHIQTLADLIDDWTLGEDGRLWWGDKGAQSGGVRHAGTSGRKIDLGTIEMSALYANR